MIKGSIQEDTTIVNIQVTLGAPKKKKKKRQTLRNKVEKLPLKQ